MARRSQANVNGGRSWSPSLMKANVLLHKQADHQPDDNDARLHWVQGNRSTVLAFSWRDQSWVGSSLSLPANAVEKRRAASLSQARGTPRGLPRPSWRSLLAQQGPGRLVHSQGRVRAGRRRSAPRGASFRKKRVSRWPGRLSRFPRSGRPAGRPCTHGRPKRTSIRRASSATPSPWNGHRAAAVSRRSQRSTVQRGSRWRKRDSRSCRARCRCSSNSAREHQNGCKSRNVGEGIVTMSRGDFSEPTCRSVASRASRE